MNSNEPQRTPSEVCDMCEAVGSANHPLHGRSPEKPCGICGRPYPELHTHQTDMRTAPSLHLAERRTYERCLHNL